MQSTFLLIAHGSRDPRPHAALEKLTELFRERLVFLEAEPSPAIVKAGVLELGPTALEAQIQTLAEQSRSLGYERVQLLPLFLLPGVHVMEDIPAAAAIAQQAVPDVQLLLRPYLGQHAALPGLLARRMAALEVDDWILLAHGSRRPGGNAPVAQLAAQLQARPAYWFVEPCLDTQIQELVAAGSQRIGILPYFLFAGTTTDGITQEVEHLGNRFPEIELRLASPLEADTELAGLLLDLVQRPTPCSDLV